MGASASSLFAERLPDATLRHVAELAWLTNPVWHRTMLRPATASFTVVREL
jgi:hypothetical protein